MTKQGVPGFFRTKEPPDHTHANCSSAQLSRMVLRFSIANVQLTVRAFSLGFCMWMAFEHARRTPLVDPLWFCSATGRTAGREAPPPLTVVVTRVLLLRFSAAFLFLYF